MQLDKLSILVINANLASRARLREVLKSSLFKAQIEQTQVLNEVHTKLTSGSVYDAAFLDLSFGMEEIVRFVGQIAETHGVGTLPIIVTLQATNTDTTRKIADLYVNGVAGFIAEPYSSDDITKLLRTIIDKPKDGVASQKVKKASIFLLREGVAYIDQLAELHVDSKGARVSGGKTIKKLREVSKGLMKLYTEGPEEYLEALTSVLESSKPSTRTRVDKSNRVVLPQRHPGFMLRELIVERGLDMKQVRAMVKIEPELFDLLIEGKHSLDEQISRELSRVVGRTAQEWNKLQRAYDSYKEYLDKVNNSGMLSPQA